MSKASQQIMDLIGPMMMYKTKLEDGTKSAAPDLRKVFMEIIEAAKEGRKEAQEQKEKIGKKK